MSIPTMNQIRMQPRGRRASPSMAASIVGAVLAGALSWAGAAAAATPAGIDMSRLSEAQVAMADISRPGVPGKTFAAATIIDAPLPKICATLQDYASYPGFMPNTESAKVSASAPDYTMVDMTLKLPMGKIKKYRLKMAGQASAQRCQLAWKLAPWDGLKQEDTIADTSGAWLLTPAANPAKTVVSYTVYTDPGPVPLGFGWIVDSMSKDSIPKMLDALRSKVRHP